MGKIMTRIVLERHGLTQAQLSKRLNYDRAKINKILRGKEEATKQYCHTLYGFVQTELEKKMERNDRAVWKYIAAIQTTLEKNNLIITPPTKAKFDPNQKKLHNPFFP